MVVVHTLSNLHTFYRVFNLNLLRRSWYRAAAILLSLRAVVIQLQLLVLLVLLLLQLLLVLYVGEELRLVIGLIRTSF